MVEVFALINLRAYGVTGAGPGAYSKDWGAADARLVYFAARTIVGVGHVAKLTALREFDGVVSATHLYNI